MMKTLVTVDRSPISATSGLDASPTPRAHASSSSSRQYSYLPTPQSPSNTSVYIETSLQTQHSPVPHVVQPQISLLQRSSTSDTIFDLANRGLDVTVYNAKQIATPVSSPVAMRNRLDLPILAQTKDTPRLSSMEDERIVTSPDPSGNLIFSSSDSMHTPLHSVSRPQPPKTPRSDNIYGTQTQASSQFRTPPSSSGRHVRVQDIIPPDVGASHYGSSPRERKYVDAQMDSIGVRIFSTDTGLHTGERKHMLPTAEVPTNSYKDQNVQLFQETSEESFEESLMAGGYGRYRTGNLSHRYAEESKGSCLESNVASGGDFIAENDALRKKTRLAAFRTSPSTFGSTSVLHTIILEGKGRVLTDGSALENFNNVGSNTPKRKGVRRKKKGAPPDLREISMNSAPEVPQEIDSPNWPDQEFPWCLRAAERDIHLRAVEEDRLRRIASILDRDSDEDEDEEIDHFTLENDRAKIKLEGRGHVTLPADPADARAALLSRRSVRALWDQNRRRGEISDACVCGASSDSEDSVQCDECFRWFHLRCMEINTVEELGGEDGSWSCPRCVARPTTSPMFIFPDEPIFAPEDEKRSKENSHGDFPFFHTALQASPATPWSLSRPPKTPTRNGLPSVGFSSGSSLDDASKRDPETPKSSYQSHFHAAFDSFPSDDSPFDPTSTPSRGIRFGAPFSTPKSSLWSARGHGMFHTPSDAEPGSSLHRTARSYGFGNLDMSESYMNALQHPLVQDDSPVRRAHPNTRLPIPVYPPESPLIAKRSRRLLEESPVIHTSAMSRTWEGGVIDLNSLDEK